MVEEMREEERSLPIARQKKVITKRRNVHRDRFMDGGGEFE
jgi:hypothetical protein